MKTYEEINQKIKNKKAVVLTAEEIIPLVEKKGIKATAKEVDVVTTGTFAPMCSTGVFLNFGHTEPPIKMEKIWLNDVPAYAGIAAVDAYLGAAAVSEKEGIYYGGGHVITDLLEGKEIKLRAISHGTNCYPLKEIETSITLSDLNQAILFNPRNAYQNYSVATNSSKTTQYTYMGILLPEFGNITYSTSGQLSPLLNDPEYRTIGIGTRIFLCGAQGYVAWEGTQHNPSQVRNKNNIPLSAAATLTLIGDLKKMKARYLQGATFKNYGATIFVGIGIPIPILNEEMVRFVSIKDSDIYANILDYGIPTRSKPILGQVNYEELRTGSVRFRKKKIPSASLSSYARAREIALELKEWIKQGEFLLSKPLQKLSMDTEFKPLVIKS